jgi:general secretion pathway protein A
MYESFYGLKENPFDITPNPEYIYLGLGHREALAQLLYGVKEKKGFIVITGEVGTGKTTLLHYLFDHLDGNGHKTKTAFLYNPKLTINDFIQYILKDLGVEARDQTKGEYLFSLHHYLINAYEKGERVVLVVDEAHGLEPTILEEIRLLSNLETSRSKLIQIILVGQPELDKTLAQPNLRQLTQRINMRYHLSPLSLNETGEYIEKRLRVAGAQERIFSKKAIREIYQKSGGKPRMINILCDNALLNGYALNRKVVDVKSVREVAKDLKLDSRSRRIWTGFVIGMSVIIAILLFIFLQRSGYLSLFFGKMMQGLQLIQEGMKKGAEG